jgi:hypothetical protein
VQAHPQVSEQKEKQKENPKKWQTFMRASRTEVKDANGNILA